MYFVQRFVVERRVFTVLQKGAVAPIIEPTERPGARTRHGGENLKFPEDLMFPAVSLSDRKFFFSGPGRTVTAFFYSSAERNHQTQGEEHIHE